MTISDAAKANLDAARRANGEFGEQHRSAPAVTIGDAIPTLVADGPVRDIVKFHNEGSWEPMTLAQARTRLGMPWNEPDETLRATIDILSKGNEDIAYMDSEHSFQNPGDDANIETDEWAAPGAFRWTPLSPTWSTDGEGVEMFVQPVAVLDLNALGYLEEQTMATERIIEDHLAKASTGRGFDVSGDVEDDGAHVQMTLAFDQDAYTPTFVSNNAYEALSELGLEEKLREIAESGAVIWDQDYNASKDINGRAAWFAAQQGHVPSDAEMVAMSRDLHPGSTLARGYLETADESFGDEKFDEIVRQWMESRNGSRLS